MKIVVLDDDGKEIYGVEIPADYAEAMLARRVDEKIPKDYKPVKLAEHLVQNGVGNLNEYKREGSVWWDHQIRRTGWTPEKARLEGLKALGSAPDAKKSD